MSTALQPQAPKLKLWRWTVQKYDRATAMGLFDRQRVELIEGRIIRMPPQMEPHAAAICLGAAALAKAFGQAYFIRNQLPIHLGKWSKPEPDLAVVTEEPNYYVLNGAPTQAALVVEVSEKTLTLDQTRKAAIYAEHGIADYWIINLVHRRLEVYRRPVSKRVGRKTKFSYADIKAYALDEFVMPLALTKVKIRVGELFPVKPPAQT
jgi:Uma2 family endonuclease